MIPEILTGLAKANLAAGLGVLPVLAIRTLVRPRFGARAAYALWLAPLVAGLAVLAPHPAARTAIAPMVASATAAVSDFVATAPAALSAGPDWAAIAFGLWLAGALAAAALLLRRQAAFLAAMGRLEPFATGGVFRAQSAGIGPAVVGVFRPRIVTPADFETRFGAGERELILAHEGVHLKRGDATVNALACAVQCLCWFNPLVHLAARLLRIDQELACDATVIDRFPAARRTYAELLLKTQLAAQPLPLGCHWPAGAEHPLKERIAMLKSPPPERAMRGMGVVVVASLTLGAGSLAWAAQPSAVSGPGEAQRAEALRQLALHPTYSCDPELERKGVGCKIIPLSGWIAVPTPDDVARYYPPGARQAGETARVHITCKTTTGGLMKGCEVLDVYANAPNGEVVPTEAFGRAALELARYFQAREPSPPNPPAREGSATFFIDIGEVRGAVASANGPPAPEPGDAPEPLVTQPVWILKPTAADIARLYPAQAAKLGVSSHAVMSCVIGADGRLPHCDVGAVEVDGPAGMPTNLDAEFRTAMRELSKSFQMESTSRDGVKAAGGVVRIPVLWNPPTPAARS